MKLVASLLISLTFAFAGTSACGQELSASAADVRATPLNLIPFPQREMNFFARFDDLTERAVGYPDKEVTTIPPRPADAPTGSQFLELTAGMTKASREQAILDELRRGNVPSFLRRLKPVRLQADDRSGERHVGVVWVLPDYLAIGSDQDFVRIPMNLHTATRIASDFGLALPTRKIVDAVYEQAEVKLEPEPFPPGKQMELNEYYLKHNQAIETRIGSPTLHGKLTAGHKKDVVLCLRGWSRPRRIMIYGWHTPDGNPIQPLSDAHLASYADYSHGIRLVAKDAEVDGQPVQLEDEIARQTLLPVFSYQPNPWYGAMMRPWLDRSPAFGQHEMGS